MGTLCSTFWLSRFGIQLRALASVDPQSSSSFSYKRNTFPLSLLPIQLPNESVSLSISSHTSAQYRLLLVARHTDCGAVQYPAIPNSSHYIMGREHDEDGAKTRPKHITFDQASLDGSDEDDGAVEVSETPSVYFLLSAVSSFCWTKPCR